MSKNNYDIIIVGAGPAGSSAAFFAKYYDKENKYKVLLLERLTENKYSTYHDICGCCISKKTFKEISPLKPNFIIENISFIKEYVVDNFIWKYRSKGFIIDRPKFFTYIIDEFKKRGGKFKHLRINSISQEKEFIKLKTEKNTTLKTKYLIAADGANSIIRQHLKISNVHKSPVNQYIIKEEPEHGVLKFFYDEKYNGDYKYIFPNGNTTRIGFPIIKGKKFKVNGNIIKKQTRLIGCGGLKKYVYGNILLVGDAAGQTNILSKGGIRPGMYAGRKATEAIIVNNNPDQYDYNWKKSGFHNTSTIDIFKKIKKMNNKELLEHYEPFKGGKKISGFVSAMYNKKYKKYIDIYRAYRELEKFGW